MADEKLTALPTGTPASTDLVYYVSDPGGSPISKASTVANLGGGGSGAVNYLGEYTGSGSASINAVTRNKGSFSGALFQSDFDRYFVELINILPATDGASIQYKVSTDGGSTYDATANYYSALHYIPNTGSVVLTQHNGDNVGTIFDNVSNTAASGGVSGRLDFFNPLSASIRKNLILEFIGARSGDFGKGTGAPLWNVITAINAFQIFCSSGNITGIMRVYGIAK